MCLWLFLKIFFIRKNIKIIIFLIFKKLFLILTHQNDLKIKKYLFETKKIKKIQFFQIRF
jgi:hypothetical protein